MRVLMIGTDESLLEAGSSSARRLAAYATRAGRIDIIVRARRGAPAVVRHADTLTVYAAPCGCNSFFPFSAFTVANRITPRGWDVVSAQDPFESGLVAWLISRLRGARLEVQMHGDFLNPAWVLEAAWHRMPRLLLARLVLRGADGVRVVSDRLRRSLRDVVEDARIVVIPVAAQAPVSQTRVDWQEVRYAGRLAREKNLGLLVRAFSAATSGITGARLVIQGDGPEREHIAAEVRRLGMEGRVRFEEWRNGGALGASGIVAVSSLHESWSRLAVEAAQSGRAVVMTDVGCAGEVIRNGESGWVVPVGDEAAFAAALRDALTHPDEARRRAARAQEIAREVPSAEELARRVVAAWQTLAARP